MKSFYLAKRYINLDFYINRREALRGTLRYGSGGQIASEKEPNRLPVLREQKVLSEVRIGPLLLREYFSYPNFEFFINPMSEYYRYVNCG